MSGLYPYQERVFTLLRQGKNVIIQAPTGAGKTRAALYPYFHMLDEFEGHPHSPLPLTCRYAVPMRVLASQFEREYHEYFQRMDRKRGTDFMRRYHEKLGLPVPAIQTGEIPDDPAFESPLTFCTIDQLLASFIGTPYSISPRMANLNVGAVAGSYLILDEFHLYPLEGMSQGARTTTLAMLQLLSGFSPFVLMTATFSTSLLASLAEILRAEVVRVTDSAEVATIMHGRERSIRLASSTMEAQTLLADHARVRERGMGASLVICNTVARAQAIYISLRDELIQRGIREQFNLELLHSRFTPQDRQKKSNRLEQWLGTEQWQSGRFLGQDTIVVATQVVEVGLNISAGVLHTELAPANSLIQRAGRCARFAAQQGEVIVYPIPPREDSDKVSYKPYASALCEATWQHIGAMIAASIQSHAPFGFLEEQHLIDQVHTAEDRALLTAFQKNAMRISGVIMDVLATHDPGRQGELIRDVEQVEVVIHPEPQDAINVRPFVWESFGLHPGTLAAAWEKLEQRRDELGLNDPGWTMRELKPAGDASSDMLGADADNDHQPRYTWEPLAIKGQQDAYRAIHTALRIALPPALATYDNEIGFRLLLDFAAPVGTWQSHESERQKRRRKEIVGKQGSYVEHITGLMRAYHFSVQREFAWIAQRLEQAMALPTGKLDLAVRLAIACHDIGKLSQGWQAWAAAWQRLLLEKRGLLYTLQPGRTWLAKTDRLDPWEWRIEREWQKELGLARPHHACESAIASAMLISTRIAEGLIDEQATSGILLIQAAISAIAHHHSPRAETYEAVAWNAAARSVIDDALGACQLAPDTNCLIQLDPRDAGGIDTHYLLTPGDGSRLQTVGTWLSFALVRVLRLCDQRAEQDL